MPLKKGFSRRSIASNISKMRSEGATQAQAVAASLETARRAAEEKGVPEKGPGPSTKRRERLRKLKGKLKGSAKE